MNDDELLLALVMRLWSKGGQLMSWEHLGVDARGQRRIIDALARLLELGFDVRVSPSGVRLVPFDDTPCSHDLLQGLRVPTVCSPVVVSTNTIASMLAKVGAPHGTVVLAEAQLQGRGRHGHSWFSPAGSGIWCSMVLRGGRPVDHPGLVGLLGGLCVLRVLRRMGAEGVVLKWTNDILWQRRKLCGVLVERVAHDGAESYVMGIGINVHQREQEFPPDIRAMSVSLDAVMQRPIARAGPLVALVREMLDAWAHGEPSGFSSIVDEWNVESGTVGAAARVGSSDGTLCAGTIVGVDADGALLLDATDGTRRTIHSGHVDLLG